MKGKKENMKNIKKILALLVAAMILVASMSVAFAETTPTTYTISVADSDTHTYKVYQILTGDLSSDGKTLSNVAWGSGVLAAKKTESASTFAKGLEGMSENDLVAALADYIDTASPVGEVKAGTAKDGLPAGYYVMVDVTDPLTNKDENGDVISTDTKALNVVKVINNVTVTKKWGTTEDKKTIDTDTLGKDEGTNEIGKDNDNVSIGDTVNYKIEAKVPDNADKFKPGTFFFVITDKLSEGLTFTEGSIEVYDGETKLTENTNYSVQYNVNNNTFEIGLVNAASYKGKTITVKYAAVLNEGAVIGDTGNPNTSTVKFSNDPNKEYDGSPEDENHPGFPDSTKDVPTGETPESETITYSTGIEILKVDENGEPLTGATFQIAGQSAKKVVTKTENFVVDNEKGTYYKLKDGTYTMTAPTNENTMIAAETGATKGYVEDAAASGEGVITVGGKTYRPYRPADDAGKQVYILKEGSKDAYADSNKYTKTVTQKTVDSDVTDHKMSEAVDANGLVRFDGLGAGEYTISETVTPNGYNTIEDVALTVTYNEEGEAKFSVSGGSAVYQDGIIKVKIVNKKGAQLPETGGIGTTIFYVAGSILVLAAVILLVTKRRMSVDE